MDTRAIEASNNTCNHHKTDFETLKYKCYFDLSTVFYVHGLTGL